MIPALRATGIQKPYCSWTQGVIQLLDLQPAGRGQYAARAHHLARLS